MINENIISSALQEKAHHINELDATCGTPIVEAWLDGYLAAITYTLSLLETKNEA